MTRETDVANNRGGLTINERILLAEETIAMIVKDKEELRHDFDNYKMAHYTEHEYIKNEFNEQALYNQKIITKIDQVLDKLTIHMDNEKKAMKERISTGKEIREWSVFIIVILGAIFGTIAFINSTSNKINHVEPTITKSIK
jgi:hypothetical protein